jgi:hypothetical protein
MSCPFGSRTARRWVPGPGRCCTGRGGGALACVRSWFSPGQSPGARSTAAEGGCGPYVPKGIAELRQRLSKLNLFFRRRFSANEDWPPRPRRSHMKRLMKFVVPLFLTGILSPAYAGTRALNPQPLPPGMKAADKASPKLQVNPQPLPPGAESIHRNSSPGSKVELNPQPYPPNVQAR